MEERKGNRKHSKEFKEEAIRLVVEGGRPVIDVARGLGIHENMLGRGASGVSAMISSFLFFPL